MYIYSNVIMIPSPYEKDVFLFKLCPVSETQRKSNREYIANRCNKIFDTVDLKHNYYGVLGKEDRQTKKWKTYLYLRKCVLDFRDLRSTELFEVLDFLRDKEDNKWFRDRLLDDVVEGPCWGSGKHEWLPRELIVELIDRSAGLVPGVKCETQFGSEKIDWLYLQAVVRSWTKDVLLKNPEGTIENGHPGAIKISKLAEGIPKFENGFRSKGSPKFHEELNKAVKISKSPASCLKRIRNIFRKFVVSGKKRITPTKEHYVLIDGTLTSDYARINFYARTVLRPAYEELNTHLKELIKFSTKLGSIEDSAEEDESESSDEEWVHKIGDSYFEVCD